MAATVQVKLNQAALKRVLQTPQGEVGRFIHKVGRDTVSKAKIFAPVETGLLKRSIHISLWPGPRNILEISADASNPRPGGSKGYGEYVHEGTGPHGIDGNPLLRFPWKKKGGVIIVTPHVNHPGNKANPFLFDALKDVVARLR